MKKIIAIALLLCMFAPIAYADIEVTQTFESFSIRNGIRFFMKRDDVSFFESDLCIEEDANSLEIQGSYAGIDNSTGMFYFDANDKLVSFTYEFGKFDRNKDTRIVGKEYVNVESALTEKYGESLLSSSSVCSDMFIADVINYIDHSYSGVNVDLRSERMIGIAQQGYVKIEHYVRVIEKEPLAYETEHKLIYTWFSSDGIAAITNTPEPEDIKGDI